ncbi:MAG: hypothetical protein JSS02_26040, partial [Planctomycetes bacterium]|nr:hypothetical protein [Planctomycetota bacterium]
HAWAGEDPLAAEAFKAASNHEADFESAVDYLVLSRLLKLPQQNRVFGYTQRFQVNSVSRLLTALDQQPRFVRDDVDEGAAARQEVRPTAAYHLQDRDSSHVAPAELTFDTVPRNIAELLIYDHAEGAAHGLAVMFSYGSDALQTHQQTLLAVGGDNLQVLGEPRAGRGLSAELFPLFANLDFPKGMSTPQVDAIRLKRSEVSQNEIWPGVPQEALGGKTPAEAAQVPELQKALAAAIVDFEIQAQSMGIRVDGAVLRARFGIPAVELKVPTESEIRALSVLQLRHVDYTKLPDEDLFTETEHARILQVGRIYAPLLEEGVKRPGLQDRMQLIAVATALSRLYVSEMNYEASIHWTLKGKQAAIEKHDSVQNMLLWELQELGLRKHFPDDSEVPALAAKLWNYYLPKLPEARSIIEFVLKDVTAPGPWNSAVPELVTGTAADASSGSGLWTPESAAAASGSSKLWLPGSE